MRLFFSIFFLSFFYLFSDSYGNDLSSIMYYRKVEDVLKVSIEKERGLHDAFYKNIGGNSPFYLKEKTSVLNIYHLKRNYIDSSVSDFNFALSHGYVKFFYAQFFISKRKKLCYPLFNLMDILSRYPLRLYSDVFAPTEFATPDDWGRSYVWHPYNTEVIIGTYRKYPECVKDIMIEFDKESFQYPFKP